jgi:glyoxylase I family protein
MSEPIPLRWAHVALNCRDQRVTEHFYIRWFGFRRVRVVDGGDGTRVVFLRLGAVCLELFGTNTNSAFDARDDGPSNPGAVRHIAFQVDDVDAFLASAGELDVSLGPLTFYDYIPRWKTVWLRDPDGVVVEVSQGYVDQDPAELTLQTAMQADEQQ